MKSKIWITTPYYRTGSTLVQRCFHACNNTVIYGELNGIFEMLCRTGQLIKSTKTQNNIANKMQNFYSKIDDDYSGCCPHEIGDIIPQLVLSEIFRDVPTEFNIGFKSISTVLPEIEYAIGLGFNVIYLTRPVDEAIASYLKTQWGAAHGPRGFMKAYDRSYNLINNPKWMDSLSGSKKFYHLEYKNISSEIGQIIKNIGLEIEDSKLHSILQNKINSGY